MKRIIISAAIVSLALSSCTKDKSEEVVTIPEATICDSLNTGFSSGIQPFILQSCATSGCHNTSSAANGYILESYSDISNNASIILQTIKHEAGVSPMPFGGAQLHDTLIQKMECWIDSGTPNN